jgi:hypothetical protein
VYVDWELERAPQRLAQTRELATLLSDAALDGPLPVFLLADRNAPPDTPEIEALTDVMGRVGGKRARRRRRADLQQ